MIHPPGPRSAADSLVEMTEIVLPEDANPRGYLFGGRVLALIDKCAAVVAMRHARAEVVTASLDSVDFHGGAHVGDVLVLHGRLNAAFGTSMEVEVVVATEDRHSGTRTTTTRAFVTMVAMAENGRPTPVPPLIARDDAERTRSSEAARRRAARLARRLGGS